MKQLIIIYLVINEGGFGLCYHESSDSHSAFSNSHYYLSNLVFFDLQFLFFYQDSFKIIFEIKKCLKYQLLLGK